MTSHISEDYQLICFILLKNVWSLKPDQKALNKYALIWLRLIDEIAFLQNGGAMRDRTADLLDANQTLSQLSYSPLIPSDDFCFNRGETACREARFTNVLSTKSKTKMVGLGRLELPTSPLSGVRSNQLSYRPKT